MTEAPPIHIGNVRFTNIFLEFQITLDTILKNGLLINRKHIVYYKKKYGITLLNSKQSKVNCFSSSQCPSARKGLTDLFLGACIFSRSFVFCFEVKCLCSPCPFTKPHCHSLDSKVCYCIQYNSLNSLSI